MKQQKFLIADENYSSLGDFFSTFEGRRIMLVHGRSMTRLKLGDYFKRSKLELIEFTDFTPNPEYASIERGVRLFNEKNCEAIIAVGGGSAIDTAKCIKLFSNMDSTSDFIDQTIEPNDIPLIAIPTTGGSGSESTQFAVIYYRDKKFSIEHESALPDAVFFDAGVLIGLPDYQKKATLLDAFCHAIESLLSVRADEQSRFYAREALRLIATVKDAYIDSPDLQNCAYVLYAANLAGRAINISKTTAGHAMSYQLTKMFGLAHGHAVARCLVELLPFMLDFALENRRDDLIKIFDEIAQSTGADEPREAIENFRRTLNVWKLDEPIDLESSLDELAGSVNLQRLANNPVKLSADDLRRLYRSIGGN